MNKQIAILMINSDIKSADDLLKKYDNEVERCAKFSYSFIEDRLVANYFKFCVDEDIDVDEYLEMFNISEPKEQFVARAQKVLNETKSKYFAELERNIDLKVWLNYDEYNPKTIKIIHDCVSKLQEKNNNTLQIDIISHETGLKKDDLENLLDLCEILNQDISVIDDGDINTKIPLSRLIKAYAKMDELVDEINKKNLSPFEKFLLVHDYAASRIYKFEENAGAWNSNPAESRHFVNVMNGDAIVCAGYAQIVKIFCKRLGIECEYLVGIDIESYDEIYHMQGMAHAANIVHIIDKKYGIDGYYFCDACWDAKKDNEQTDKGYFYAALPMQDIDEIEQARYFSNVVKNMNIPQISVPISMDIFKRALNTVYSDHSQVEENLQRTVRKGYHSCSFKSENCFMQEYIRQYKESSL